MMTMRERITHRLVLVELTVTQWSGVKLDKVASERLCEAAQADGGSARVRKTLVPQDVLAAPRIIAKRAREYLYSKTMPWRAGGQRLLLASNLLMVQDTLTDMQSQFRRAVEDMLDSYGEAVERARSMLGDLFDSADYPARQDIARRFSFYWTVDPVPTGDHMVIDVADSVARHLQDRVDAQTHDALQPAMQDVWQRLHAVVERMATTLQDPAAIFRDTLVGNVRDLLGIIPDDLQIDPDLQEVVDDVKTMIDGLTPDELRSCQRQRSQTADEAAAIMRRMGVR